MDESDKRVRELAESVIALEGQSVLPARLYVRNDRDNDAAFDTSDDPHVFLNQDATEAGYAIYELVGYGTIRSHIEGIVAENDAEKPLIRNLLIRAAEDWGSGA